MKSADDEDVNTLSMESSLKRSDPEMQVLTAMRSTLDRVERELLLDPRLQSRHTRRAYLTDLRAFEAWRSGRTLTKGLVEEYAVHLYQIDLSPNSINRALASVRWWARRLADLAYEEPLSQANRDEVVLQATRVAGVRDVKGERDIHGRHIALEEFQVLLTTCAHDPTPAGVRDATLFTMAWSTGMRRSEIAGLKMADVQEKQAQYTLQVQGKGNKVRRAYLQRGAASWLTAWLRHRGHDLGAVFCPIRKGGKLVANRGITEAALAAILGKRRRQAALAEPLTWHDFRRTFAGNLLDAGVDLVTVQKLLGHSSPVTTSNYDRRGEATKQKAVGNINIPLWPDGDKL
jgi:site-specific recombinase XerD